MTRWPNEWKLRWDEIQWHRETVDMVIILSPVPSLPVSVGFCKWGSRRNGGNAYGGQPVHNRGFSCRMLMA